MMANLHAVEDVVFAALSLHEHAKPLLLGPGLDKLKHLVLLVAQAAAAGLTHLAEPQLTLLQIH